MYSLWDDASRDTEAENAIRRTAMTEAELDSRVFSFVALSKTSTEYGHRKALIADTLRSIAEKTGASFDEVVNILDRRMAYILEASKLAADEGEFIIVDANGSKIGGPYPSREAASAALNSGKFESIDGARVVSEASQGKTSSKKKDEEDGEDAEDYERDEKEKNKKKSSINEVAQLIRQALQEGKDPIDWVRNLPAGGGEGGPGVTSQHSTDSDPGAGLPGGSIPPTPPAGIDGSGYLADQKEANVGGTTVQNMMNAGQGLLNAVRPDNDMFTQGPGFGAPNGPTPNGPGAPGNPNPNNPGTSPPSPMLTQTNPQPGMQNASNTGGSTVTDSANGVKSTGSLEARIAVMRDEIARYNPNLSPERVNEVAYKVAQRYLNR